ncbi:helix-turn-helix transcriptional regulator [Bacteroides faecis]|nr:helix-turn-helix transcriptional regulator [Bacteroides faecis]
MRKRFVLRKFLLSFPVTYCIIKRCVVLFNISFYTLRSVPRKILERLCQCKKTNILSNVAYNSSNLLPEVNEPVNRVYAYLFNHFKEKITLKEIADYVKQNPSALCRYFKQRTDKNIFQCLAEIRIEHACKLLAYSNLTIAQVAYESGYNYVPHFIMQFEKIVKRTPSEYKSQIDSL